MGEDSVIKRKGGERRWRNEGKGRMKGEMKKRNILCIYKYKVKDLFAR